jgi:REP element-mobilizing transposase RayT
MGRPLRVFEADGIYHLTTHGVDDRPIFIDDVDRQSFALRLLRIVRRERWAIWAACLMDTHYHAVVQPLEARVGDGMRVVNGAHSRAFNRRHERRGALFESRYTDTPIKDEAHLWSTVNYVHDNPVRAGMVDHPGDWPWSTYPGCALARLLGPHLRGV